MMSRVDCELLMSAGERGNDTRGKKEDDVGVVTVQGEHDGLEEDRSDPEGRGAHGPARPT